VLCVVGEGREGIGMEMGEDRRGIGKIGETDYWRY
jgi:hypothetical protein